MRIRFREEELARVLPAEGRYLARIEHIVVEPLIGLPEAIELALRIDEPLGLPGVIRDKMCIRGARPEHDRATDMRRLLDLLHAAELELRPDIEIELDVLLGMQVLVDVRRATAAAGYPFSRIVTYSSPARRAPVFRTQPISETVTRPVDVMTSGASVTGNGTKPPKPLPRNAMDQGRLTIPPS